jgi:hypothetical protein
MELVEGKIEFDSVGKFISNPYVRSAIAGRVGKLIPKMKAKTWEQLAQMMLSACIEEDGGKELQYEGAARIHIEQYLADTQFISSLRTEIPQNRRKPMLRDGRITVSSTDLQTYINKTTGQNLSVRIVAAMLSAIGAKTIRVRETRLPEQSRWELPLHEFDPADYVTAETEDAVQHG